MGMCILEKPGSPIVTDNIRVKESAQEITYRPVINGQESEEERVFALRSEPLGMEMFCRNSKNSLRLQWQAPRSIATGVFDATLVAAGGTVSIAKKAPAGVGASVVGMGWTSP